MGNAQEGPTHSHPAQQLPSCLKASPPHTSGTSLLPTSELEDVGSSAGPFHPRLMFGSTEAQGGWLGQLRAQASSQLTLGSRCLRPRAHGGQGQGPAGRVSRAAGTGARGVGGSLHPLPTPRLFATDGKWQLRKQRFLALPDHSWENRWPVIPPNLAPQTRKQYVFGSLIFSSGSQAGDWKV